MWVFEVSAEGIREFIPAVNRLVSAAPKIEGWVVKAFRQRNSEVATVCYRGAELGVESVWFKATDGADEKLDIEFAISAAGGEKSVMGALFLLLDSVIGEFEMMTRVGTVDVGMIPPGKRPRGDEWLPVIELRNLI